MSKYAYTTARSYTPSCAMDNKEVIALLEKGYEFVRASEFVPPNAGKAGYIEYVLRIPLEETDAEKEKLKADVKYWRQIATNREETMRKLDAKIADNAEAWDKLEAYLGRRMEHKTLTQRNISELDDIIKKVHECRGGKEE